VLRCAGLTGDWVGCFPDDRVTGAAKPRVTICPTTQSVDGGSARRASARLDGHSLCVVFLGTAVQHALQGSGLVQAIGLPDGPSRSGTHQNPSSPTRRIDEAGALRHVDGFPALGLLRPPPTASRRPRHFPGSPGYRRTSLPTRPGGAEEALSSSQDNRLTVPLPIRRGVLEHPLQDPWCCPWPSPSKCRLGSPLSR